MPTSDPTSHSNNANITSILDYMNLLSHAKLISSTVDQTGFYRWKISSSLQQYESFKVDASTRYSLLPSDHNSLWVEKGWNRMSAQWVETGWNRRVHSVDENLFPTSSEVREWASERTNERSGARERSEQCGASAWVSGASERANGGANGPVLDFIVILSNVARFLGVKRVLC